MLGMPAIGRKRKRCGTCSGCTNVDCGTCVFCLDKPKFGGSSRKKQCCEKRKCVNFTSCHRSKVWPWQYTYVHITTAYR